MERFIEHSESCHEKEASSYFVKITDPVAKKALWEGFIEKGSSKVRVVAADYFTHDSTIRFEKTRTEASINLATWIESLRIYSLTATALPVLATIAFVSSFGATIDWLTAITAFIGAVTLQLSVNLLNDVEDHLRLIDFPGGPGGAGVIQKGLLTAKQIHKLGIIAFVVGAGLGLPALLKNPIEIFMIGLIAVLGTYGYSSGVGFKYKALGDLVVFLLCGPLLTAGASFAATGVLSAEVLWLGAFFGFAAVGILHVNNMQDIELDSSRSAKTLASLLGFGLSRWFLVSIYLVAILCLFIATFEHPQFSWATAALLPSVLLAAGLIKKIFKASGCQSPHLQGARVKAAQLHLVAGSLVTVYFFVSKALGV
ncbi:MAG: hypothetical protein COT74_05165 [Bdellovibrionales bacterium CG10_big_fil_rev_8_21_14_0_10_45_34]|nr:MAG: hypothetical protein COT74_05165 [Bdellovibrionales bacterium CG10_big_fil_rev_8_21_14_0_10_45_34]